MAPQRRRWNGLPNERLIQKMTATAIITGAVGRMSRAASDAAPTPRTSASCRAERGPTRPAKALSRLAMNGAAASAARPERLETATPGDGREQRGDERRAHADADGRDQVERQVAPDRALRR